MAPEHLCSAFTEAIQALDIQIRERLILLKQFDRYVISNLGMLLDEANRILIQAGVIPNFRYHGKKNQSQKPSATADSSAESPSEATAGYAHRPEDTVLFDQIRQMLALQRSMPACPQRRSLSESGRRPGTGGYAQRHSASAKLAGNRRP